MSLRSYLNFTFLELRFPSKNYKESQIINVWTYFRSGIANVVKLDSIL